MNNWKVTKLHLTEKSYSTDLLHENDSDFGGRAFTSRWLDEQVNPGCDPLGPCNDLIVATGLLAGSGASSSYRTSIGAKSPLTGGIKESNTGGKAGYAMSQLGLRALILHGVASDWQQIYISKAQVQFISALELMGKNIYETVHILQQTYGKQAVVIAIGPAGEMGLSASSIGISDMDGIPARHSARGGLAAVMGSKKIKAIVIDHVDSSAPGAVDEDALRASKQRFVKALRVVVYDPDRRFIPVFCLEVSCGTCFLAFPTPCAYLLIMMEYLHVDWSSFLVSF